jgi:FkbM family methyltransferase
MKLNMHRIQSMVSIRRLNVLLVLVLLLIVGWYWGLLKRKLIYNVTGTVTVEGSTFRLPPDDPFLQYVLVRGDRDTEATLGAVLRRGIKPGDVVIDVGANIGWFTLMAAKQAGPEGLVIAFEPEPRNFAWLKQNVDLNECKNVRLEQKALSDKAGSIRLYLSQTNENHSIAPMEGGRGSIDVEAIRFDDYPLGSSKPIRWIKIDTEGAEGLIVKGMRETLKSPELVGVVMEFNPVQLKPAGTDPLALLHEVHDLGFTVHRIDERTRTVRPVDPADYPSLAAWEGGNLLLRRGLGVLESF